MGFLNWIKGEVCRGSNSPCEGDEITTAEWKAMRTTFPDGTMQGGNCSGGPVTPKPPIKPQPTGGRLIYGNRDPGPVPPRFPNNRDDLPVLTAQHMDGAAVGQAPIEMPSDELMQQWRDTAYDVMWSGGEATWRTAALLAFAEGRRQAQSLKLPPPGADPVATDEDLIVVATGPVWSHHAYRAIYEWGRSDERTAILRVLGVEP